MQWYTVMRDAQLYFQTVMQLIRSGSVWQYLLMFTMNSVQQEAWKQRVTRKRKAAVAVVFGHVQSVLSSLFLFCCPPVQAAAGS